MINPFRDPRAALIDEEVDAARKRIKKYNNVRIYLFFILCDAPPCSEQALQVIASPTVLTLIKPEFAFAQLRPSLHFRKPSLRFQILKHHTHQVVLGLCVAVPKKSGFLRIADDVRNSVPIAVNTHPAS